MSAATKTLLASIAAVTLWAGTASAQDTSPTADLDALIKAPSAAPAAVPPSPPQQTALPLPPPPIAPPAALAAMPPGPAAPMPAASAPAVAQTPPPLFVAAPPPAQPAALPPQMSPVTANAAGNVLPNGNVPPAEMAPPHIAAPPNETLRQINELDAQIQLLSKQKEKVKLEQEIITLQTPPVKEVAPAPVAPPPQATAAAAPPQEPAKPMEPPPPPGPQASNTPQVAAIEGTPHALEARLVLPNGMRIRATAGTHLPDGVVVSTVAQDHIVVSKNGQAHTVWVGPINAAVLLAPARNISQRGATATAATSGGGDSTSLPETLPEGLTPFGGATPGGVIGTNGKPLIPGRPMQ